MTTPPSSPTIGDDDDDDGGIVPSSVASRILGGKPAAAIQLSPEEKEALADGFMTLEEILEERAKEAAAASGTRQTDTDAAEEPQEDEDAVAPPVRTTSTRKMASPPPPAQEQQSLDTLGAALLEDDGEDRGLRFASFGVSGLRVGGDESDREDLVRQARDRGLRGVCGLIGFRIPVNRALRNQAKAAAIPEIMRLPQPTNPGRPRKNEPHAAQDKLDAVTQERPTKTVRHEVFGSFDEMIPTAATPISSGGRSPKRSLTMTPIPQAATEPPSRPEAPPPIESPRAGVKPTVAPPPPARTPTPAPLPPSIGAEHRAVEDSGLQRPDPKLVAAIDLHEGEVKPLPHEATPVPFPVIPERSVQKPEPASPRHEFVPDRRTWRWPSWGNLVAAGLVGGTLAGFILLKWREQPQEPDGSIQVMTERRQAVRTYIQSEVEVLEFRLGSLDTEIDGLVAELSRQDAIGKGELAPRLEVKARERARVLVVLEALKARRKAIDEGKGM